VADQKIQLDPIIVNLSPALFKNAAQDYFKCYLDFKPKRRFSGAPYYLCCLAIELGLKAIHLETANRGKVKSSYGHRLVKSYDDLPVANKTLTPDEFDVLKQADAIYNDAKGFEYLQVGDAATAYSRFPDLEKLAGIARKLTDYKD
jgi:hypothetical protein